MKKYVLIAAMTFGFVSAARAQTVQGRVIDFVSKSGVTEVKA